MSASAQRLHNALTRLAQLDYKPVDFMKELLASTDDVCAQARDDLRAGAMDIIVTLLAGTRTPFRGALWCLRQLNISPGGFIVDMVGCSDEEIAAEVTHVLPALLAALLRRHSDAVREWAIGIGLQLYGAETVTITRKTFGFHATVTKLQPAQIEHFDLSDLAQKLRSGAPRLWELISHLLSAAVDRRRTPMTAESQSDAVLVLDRRGDLGAHDDLLQVEPLSATRNGSDSLHGSASVAENAVEQGTQDPATPTHAPVGRQMRPSAASVRNTATHQIQMLTIFGIVQHANNQQCNAIPTNMGTFLRMMHVPDAVIGVLHHAGVTVSNASMDLAVTSLSTAEEKRMRLQGSSRTSQAAFDNFNFNERVAVGTAGRDNVFHSAISALHISSPPTLTPES